MISRNPDVYEMISSTRFRQSSAEQAARLVYAATLMATLLWLVLLFAAPLLLSNHHPLPALILYQSFSAICHQIAERSFHLHEFPLAVCSRCTGIYAGFLIGLLVYPLVRRLAENTMPHRRWLLLAATPMLLDVVGDSLGLLTNTFFSRTLTGLIAGAVTAFYLLPGLVATWFQFAPADLRKTRTTVFQT